MKVLKSWLKDFVKINLSDEELAEKLSLTVLPVESHQKIGAETVFDVEVSPNRSDCLSHFGIAREIAAITQEELKTSSFKIEDGTENNFTVEVADQNLCPQYYGRMIRGVKIGPSSEPLAKRLAAINQKSVNNLVDITNYILFDLGQPLHAFDLKKISGGKIVVRLAKGEEITTLDGVKRQLDDKMLAIGDAEKPVALAGIMGGKNSEVDDGTTDIILEAAEFEPKNIRQTAKRLGLTTESSYRFERGIDSGRIKQALDKATQMILDYCGGKVVQTICVGKKPQEVRVPYEAKKITDLLGVDLAKTAMDNILKSLGCVISGQTVVAPTWRKDLNIWQDLAEEIGRLAGLEKIKTLSLPAKEAPAKSEYYYLEYLKDILVNIGFDELENYIFLSENDLEIARLEKKNLLEVANPIQQENKYLRNSLIAELLKGIAKNTAFSSVAVFEIGRVFGDKESIHLALAASGKNAKQLIEQAVGKLTADLKISPDKLMIKELSREDLSRYKIKKPMVYFSEIELDEVLSQLKFADEDLALKISPQKVAYRPVSRFPAVGRDLAFVTDTDISNDDIRQTILEVSDKVLIVELFDEFTSDKLGAGKKSIAFHLYLQDLAKALTDAEADAIIQNVIKQVTSRYGGQLRQ